ncbi:1,4-alpha-glucan branching protein GlgB [Shewanella sp. Scap07]|uniref:1,4-alpha-glucan branching protein GlgB n=1 Tax=Shewanella sp. Scap07 TaxID=2589987 RepID=UPI0015BA9825|nr:1,4-alpha-glucan branching protein GlgB [Shewanella sp. Scap07]QLE84728.1 1,4-alpha-glucan branching protein GlgB [Shewanella sp. Scap07]
MTQNAPHFHDGADIALLQGEYIDVFSLLGMHQVEQQSKTGKATKKLLLRCFLRGAQQVEVLTLKDKRKVATLNKEDDEGLFAGFIPRRVNPFPYLLRVTYPQSVEEIVDPYQFQSLLTEQDVYLFAEGKLRHAYQFLGANPRTVDGIDGVLFCVWAPNAKRVSLLGDFNYWDGARHVMRQHVAHGIWEIFIPQVAEYSLYKFEIIDQQGQRELKADPFAKAMDPAPSNASKVVLADDYAWQDTSWMQARQSQQWHQQPVSIYEVHLGSWRRQGDSGQSYLDYTELQQTLLPYVKEMGFTHLQLMPVSEYPFDGSWGYQPVGMYAPSHRFGSPVELKAFIDHAHQLGLAVILDWVAAHFPKDPHGLRRFDGTCLFEHDDPKQGEHPDWDTLIYNYGRAEVQSYLLSNACYYLEEFHFDGLRLDAVSSMLYLDYSREAGEWLPNEYGGRENLQAINLLKRLNSELYQAYPGILMIAEESTAWPGVTQSVEHDGLGFGFKWNMGWMNDTLRYLCRDPLYRSHHHSEMTFGLMYGFSEQFILSLSHDEVVHGKGSLLHKIPGDDWQKFATLRAYYGFMWGHPGKKLLFMGNEFAQRDEWNHQQSLDWHLLQYSPHQGVQDWLKDLNRLYQVQPALYSQDNLPQSFSWLDCDNADNSVFCFMRHSQTESLIFVVNMTPQVHHGYRLGLPTDQQYVELLNSDSQLYGGSNVGNHGVIVAQAQPYQECEYSAEITVPPLACLVIGLNNEAD